MHTAHRALLMRLITPKRLSENEAFMWRLADRQLDEFVANGECEFISDFASPFALLVIADLLGVPEADHEMFRDRARGEAARDAPSAAPTHAMRHNPLEFLYARFTDYVEDRRRDPSDDVLTGLATATFPDGSLPDVIDVVRVAANLFAAGQETTVRLLAAALQMLGEHPDLQDRLRAEPDRIPNFVEEMLRFESPIKGDFRLSRVATTVGGVDIPAGTTVMVLNGAANRDPRRFDRRRRVPARPRERAAAHRVRARRAHLPGRTARARRRRASASNASSTACATSRSPRPSTARPARAATTTCRRTSCAASTRLHLEFTPPADAETAPLRAPEEAVDVRAEVGRVERLGLGRHREVDGGEHRPLDVQVQHALRRLHRLARERGDLVRGGERGGEHLAVGAHVIGETDLGGPLRGDPVAGERVLLREQQARVQRPVSGPPSAATRPTVTCGSDRYADSAMYTTSESAITLQPSPTAGPLTAATTGTRHRIMLSTSSRPSAITSWRSARSFAMRSRRSKSPPAENARPSPVIDRDPRVGVGTELREQPREPEVQLLVDRVELLGTRRAARSAPVRRPRRG